ncbi:hypothetical protein GWC77_25945 [Paraburkholderia sp. NMBU_R16]|uniref:hypothetical protein n=1 Tax=Paraburkholderia sp. NMBU_R16 TaxID=2698676 RepID=UPI00156575FB|nr:hypothetical protein [Paraburkholderia sp. NMBU_R16]NRO99333.1 hypothetical protein [Paraburkholderia sp. NMBU_R16]
MSVEIDFPRDFWDIPHLGVVVPTVPADLTNQNPGFIVPPRNKQTGQPFVRDKPGFTAIKANSIRPFPNLFNAAALTVQPPAATDLSVAGLSASFAQEGIGGGLNGHALLASAIKRRRYGRQLDLMLNADVRRFKAKPELATLILTKGKNGRYRYDMDKVAKLAASDNPEHSDEIANAKNVFLTAYIKDEVAAKRCHRAKYEILRNTLGMASAGLLVGATHGVAAASSGATVMAAKKAGLSIGLINAFDVAASVRGFKQRMRDEKQRDIDEGFLTRRLDLKDCDIPDDTPEAGIDIVHAAMRDDARIAADRQTFRVVFKGAMIDHQKSSLEKGRRAQLAAEHACAVVDYHVKQFARSEFGKLEAFHRTVHRAGSSRRQKDKMLASLIKRDENLRIAYDLMRDIGMRRGEAAATIHGIIARKLEHAIAMDADRPLGATTEAMKQDAADDTGKPDGGQVRAFASVLRRR